MTIYQAAGYVIPNIGPHRNRPLACVALDHPEYLVRLAEHGAPECPIGGQFHTAVSIVVERMRANAELDIAEGRTLDPALARTAVAELRSDGGLLGGKATKPPGLVPGPGPAARRDHPVQLTLLD